MPTHAVVSGRPGLDEAAPYYQSYVGLVPGDDALGALEAQAHETPAFLESITEARSLYRYAPDKWSIREVWSHVNDTERVMLFRALWFARGFDSPLPSFDQMTCAGAARADERSWASHVEEFRAVRLATLTFFRELPAEAWTRAGIASENRFTVRALAYILAGHVVHHAGVLRQRYT
jgi:DinB superfamily